MDCLISPFKAFPFCPYVLLSIPHEEVFNLTRNAGFSQIILVGDNFEHYGNSSNFIRHFRTTDDLLLRLNEQPIQDACILVKGSRGNRLERIVEYL